MAETTTAAEIVSIEWVEEFADRWIAAWNSHQPERVLELMTDDIVYDDSGWPQTMRGHAEVRELLDFTWRAFPDLRFEISDGPFLHASQPEAAFYWDGYATHTGPIEPPGWSSTSSAAHATSYVAAV